jgi:hypothetical protein
LTAFFFVYDATERKHESIPELYGNAVEGGEGGARE